MLLIVADCFNASSQMATTAEKKAAALTWTRILSDVIPQNRLFDVLNFAFKKHTSSFPINAYDLKNRWTDLEAEELAERKKAEAEERSLNRVLHCGDLKSHKSETEAMQEYFIHAKGEYVWLPCATCRYDAHWQRVKDIKNSLTTEKSNEQILIETEEFKNFQSGLKLVK
jgi:hypothetical protein